MAKNGSTKQNLDYSVVLVEYFSSNHIIDCIKSIYNQTKRPEKIVVVINGIDQIYKEKIIKEFPEVALIDPGDNLGYAKAANLGIANTPSPIVLTLNPDTILNEDVALLSCEYMASNEEVGSLGPQILESNGNIYPSARKEPSIMDSIGHAILGSFFPNNRFSKSYKNLDVKNDEIRETDWLSGAALFIRRDALDEIGGWDEDYFMYCEDIDLGNKLRNSMWKNVYFPNVQIMHVQGVSTSRTPIKLLLEHHKSLYTYSSKKYKNNFIMKILVFLFVSFRFPMAVVAHKFRLN